MNYKNPKDLLIDAPKILVGIEAMLPAGAPVISTMLVDAAEKMPVLPDFLIEIPELPELPALPEMPAPPGEGEALRRRIVTGAEVKPLVPAAPAVRRRTRFLY